MNNLRQYLEKYKNIGAPQDAVRAAVVRTVKNLLGADIEKRHIRILNRTVYVDAASHLKNSIFIKKETILAELQKEFGDQSPKGIL